MTINDVFTVCRVRGVRLVIAGDQLRAQGRKGAVSDALRNALVEHKQALIDAYGDGIWPDDTLPVEIIIPASVPNTVAAITACVNAQRLSRAA